MASAGPSGSGARSEFNNYGSGLQPIHHGNGDINFYPNANANATEIDDRLLRDLCTAGLSSASDHINPRNDRDRLSEGLLENASSWILAHEDFKTWKKDDTRRLFWIKGGPGKGKTKLLCHIIDHLESSCGKDENPTYLLSYFFCQATDASINNAAGVLRGLMLLLFEQHPQLMQHARDEYQKLGAKMFEGRGAWYSLRRIFKNMLLDTDLPLMIIIIDALDECGIQQRELVSLINETSISNTRIKWLVSSRNVPEISEILDGHDGEGQRIKFSLELNDIFVSNAVEYYIQHVVSQLARKKSYLPALEDEIRNYLLENSENTFLWVALVYQELDRALKARTRHVLKQLPRGLPLLYERMMEGVQEDPVAQHILATVLVACRPLSFEELACLDEEMESYRNDFENPESIVESCGSFLAVRKNTIYIVHQSAKDFLVDASSKYFAMIFPKGREAVHELVFSRCMHWMGRGLRRDIYGLHHPGISALEAKTPSPDPLAQLQYACIYWARHLAQLHEAEQLSRCENAINVFLRSKFLNWLEALSLLGSFPDGVTATGILLGIGDSEVFDSALKDLIFDANRFIRYHAECIKNYPLQIYVSALLFSPAKSKIRIAYQSEEPDWIVMKPIMEDQWGTALQVLGQLPTNGVVFSPDSNRFALIHESFVKVLDVRTGHILLEIKESLQRVAFSTDARLLAGYGLGRLICIWDTENGKKLKGSKVWPFETCESLCFRQDSNEEIMAIFVGLPGPGYSLSYNWVTYDLDSDRCLREGQFSRGFGPIISPNLGYIALAGYGKVELISLSPSSTCRTLPNERVSKPLSFSSDSKTLAILGQRVGSISIISVSSLQLVRTINLSSLRLPRCSWPVISPDFRHLVLGDGGQLDDLVVLHSIDGLLQDVETRELLGDDSDATNGWNLTNEIVTVQLSILTTSWMTRTSILKLRRKERRKGIGAQL